MLFGYIQMDYKLNCNQMKRYIKFKFGTLTLKSRIDNKTSILNFGRFASFSFLSPHTTTAFSSIPITGIPA